MDSDLQLKYFFESFSGTVHCTVYILYCTYCTLYILYIVHTVHCTYSYSARTKSEMRWKEQSSSFFSLALCCAKLSNTVILYFIGVARQDSKMRVHLWLTTRAAKKFMNYLHLYWAVQSSLLLNLFIFISS